jgi:DNA topoisomerase-3
MQLSPQGFSLTYTINSVYDVLLLFYDDCSVANTTVIGKAADVAFKTTGKVILDGALFLIPPKKADLLPDFIKGEKDHTNPRFRKLN